MIKLLNLNTAFQQVQPSLEMAGQQIARFGGYQDYLLLGDVIIPRNPELIKKDRLVRPRLEQIPLVSTALDLGCANMYFGILARLLCANKVHGIDADGEYVEKVKELLDEFNLAGVSIKEKNISAVTGEYDIVFALAIIHWIYSCSALFGSLEKVVRFLSGLTKKYLFIEWLDPKDRAISEFGHLEFNKEETKGDYTFNVFWNTLHDEFEYVESLGFAEEHREIWLGIRE